MSISSRNTSSGLSENRRFYATSFVRKSHIILKAGYDRLDPASYTTSEEEDITGELTKGMQEALEQPDAPSWYKHFWATEEVHVHHPTRKGKHRKRIDIEIIKSQAGKRPVLRFEAKRLRSKADATNYLGPSGLGCFLDGSYAANDDVVGMIGYVQHGTTEAHANSIKSMMNGNPEKYSLDVSVNWKPQDIADGLETYLSRHQRKPLATVDVLHTLLPFF